MYIKSLILIISKWYLTYNIEIMHSDGNMFTIKYANVPCNLLSFELYLDNEAESDVLL